MIRVLLASTLAQLALSAALGAADLASAQQLFDEGRDAEALTLVEALLAEDPADPELRFLKGIIFAQQERSDEAIEVFAGITRDYPRLPEPYNNLAVLFAEKGQYEKARDALLAAIDNDPGYSTAHENLGDLYARLASLAYQRALEEDAENASARIKLAAVDGIFSEAAEHASRVPGSSSQPDTVTVPAVAAPGGDTSAVMRAVERWRDAWAAGDADGYVAAYAPDYSPSRELNHQAWTAQLRERLAKPAFIDVSLGEVQIELTREGIAQAVFVQDYRSDRYRDRVRKTLILAWTASGWRIVEERSEPL